MGTNMDRKVWINATDEDGVLLDRIAVKVPSGQGRLTICHGDPCLHNEAGALDIGCSFTSGLKLPSAEGKKRLEGGDKGQRTPAQKLSDARRAADRIAKKAEGR